MALGIGIDMLNGSIKGKAVDPGPTTKTGSGSETLNQLLIATTFEEFEQSIGIEAEANASFGFFDASAKFDFQKKSSYNRYSTFLVARCVVRRPFEQADDPLLQSNPNGPSELLKNGDVDRFRERYGDCFIRGIQQGGELIIVFQFSSISETRQSEASAALQFSISSFLGGGGSGKFELSQENKEKISRTKLRLDSFQIGGDGDQQAAVTSIDEAVQRLKDFPAQVKSNPVTYQVQAAKYTILDLPAGPALVDIENQRQALIEYSRLQNKFKVYKNDIEFIQSNPAYFQSGPTLEKLNEWQQFFSEQLNILQKSASECSRDSTRCPSYAFKLPPDFKLPKRIKESQLVTVENIHGFNLLIFKLIKLMQDEVEKDITPGPLDASQVNARAISLRGEYENEGPQNSLRKLTDPQYTFYNPACLPFIALGRFYFGSQGYSRDQYVSSQKFFNERPDYDLSDLQVSTTTKLEVGSVYSPGQAIYLNCVSR